MADLKARLKPIFRRSSTLSSASASSSIGDTLRGPRSQCKSSLRLSTSRKTFLPISVFEEYEPSTPLAPFTPTEEYRSKGDRKEPSDTSPETPRSPALETRNPILVVEAPTPEIGVLSQEPVAEESRPDIAHQRHLLAQDDQSRPTSSALLIESPALQPAKTDYFGGFTVSAGMLQKKIWVKRPGSSATQVTISGEDLVDDVRDMILKKYANSLGRSCDPPDITLRLAYRKQSARHSNCERTLGPEEPLLKLLDLHYPGGQSVEEALVIDIPQRRTPKHSPRMAMPYYLHDDTRPHEDGTDYFPPMPQAGQHSPHLPSNVSVSSAKGSSHHPPSHSMAVLTTAHLPNLPSPGSRMPRHSQHRQKYGRQHTTSPTVLQGPPNALNYGRIPYTRSASRFS